MLSTDRPILIVGSLNAIRVMRLLTTCLAVCGPTYTTWAENDCAPASSSAWQSKPFHLRGDGKEPTLIRDGGDDQGSVRRSVLNWKIPDKARPLTRSTPRPEANDPFHDPFGDRRRNDKAVGPDSVFARSAGTEPPPKRVPILVPSEVGRQAAATQQPTVELASAKIAAATEDVPSPFVIDPRSEPTLADPRERPQHTVTQLSPFKIRPKKTADRGEARRSTSAGSTPVSATLPRSNRPSKGSAHREPALKAEASARNNQLPPLLIFASAPQSHAPHPATRAEPSIADPSQAAIRTAQFETSQFETSQLPDDLLPEAVPPADADESNALNDLFAPEEPPQPAILEEPPADQPELGEDTDFNRPFEYQTEEPPPGRLLPAPEEDQRPAPGMGGLDGMSDPDIERKMESLFERDDESRPRQAAPICDRVYNDRDCCDEENACASYITQLRSKRISDIHLDISPPYMPLSTGDGEQPVDADAIRKQVPSRSWTDRRGRTIAEGKLYALRDAGVMVQDGQGNLDYLPWLEMSRDDQCFVTAWWKLPVHCTPDDASPPIRDFALTTMTWTASALCHKPLYFQDVQLERYGHSAGPIAQPFLSGAHFFSSLALLPYQMGMYPPNECRYALGYYRPGNCAPWMISAFPLSKRGAISQAAFMGAMFGIFH